MILKFRGKYGFLSNFHDAPVTYYGLTYRSSEAAFQAAKSLDPEVRKRFTTMDPTEAKRAGRRVDLRSDWNIVKYRVMYDVCLAKFTQNDDLRVKLLSTGDEYLEEGNTWGDREWGTVDGIGENNLGITLMVVRDKLRGRPSLYSIKSY